MALANVHLSSNNSLKRAISATLIIPEKKRGPFPVLYLLHGLSDDHTAWTRFTNIERYVGDIPLIVVMPDSERGYSVDAVGDPSKRFESLIIDDLIAFVDQTFHTRAERSGRAIAGLSMGGYGALRLAFRHPDLFCAAHGFSSGFAFPTRGPMDAEFRLVFGDGDASGTDYDLFTLATKAKVESLPTLSFDCGVNDFSLAENRAFHSRLDDLSIPHSYTEYPGEHNWVYWNEHLLTALPGLLAALGVAAQFDPNNHLPHRSPPIA